MQKRYKITISNNFLYKEVELPVNESKISVGTSNNCVIRLRKDDFLEPVNFLLFKENDRWQVGCSENIYISDGEIGKLFVKELSHGTSFELRYQSSNQIIFEVLFELNFETTDHVYDKVIDINSKPYISIGDYSQADFVLNTPYTQGTRVNLTHSTEGLIIEDDNSPYGILINGSKAETGDIIKNTDFFSISDCFFYYKNGRLYTENSNKIITNKFQSIIQILPNDYPKFTRNTRIKTVINDEKIEILDPPNKPEKKRENILLRILPSFGMLIAAAIMAKMGGAGMLIFAGVSGVMAIITTILTLIDNKKEFKRQTNDRITQYNDYIKRKEEEIQKAREKEKSELQEIYISTEEELKRIQAFSPHLFDRHKTDEDFLCLRLGLGKIDAVRQISYKKQEKLELADELQVKPEELCNSYKKIEPAPVFCDLKNSNAIGICGHEIFRYEFFKKILVDIASRHFHADVKIALVTTPNHFDWVNTLRFLPHLLNPVNGQRNIVNDEESRNQLFEALYTELTQRETNKGYDYNLVIFMLDEYNFKTHPLSKFVEKAASLGATFIFFEESQDKLPQGCSHIIVPKYEDEGTVIDTSDKNKSIDFKYTTITDKQMFSLVKLLAPIYIEDLTLEGTLTKNLTLYEMLDILSADDLDLQSRWKNSRADKTMIAPIGVSSKGTISLDLHDSAHGPHGLVAGTTGSGKSELLLTYILSMATLYHPYEVGFVIIDFKGGGMANQLKDLPHLIGTITNIDGKEIDRSLKSIKAELRKRQKYFADAEVNHIDKYIEKYKNNEVTEPLPHLIIIVDEFAELKAEQPDFMKELISAARIGRSLGVHLILATQKPAGQVDDQIWSNSRFKLCLKVQDESDSKEVLKSPLAAEIREPGRAYLQVGNNEIFELFQSGYSGAPERVETGGGKEYKIFEMRKNGQKKLVYHQKKKKVESQITQLDAVVDTISNYTKTNKIKKLPPICLPPLPEKISYKGKRTLQTGITVDIGLYDDPNNQLQNPYCVNLTENNMMIIGSSQTGKSNLLQTIIRSAASKYSSDQVIFYIIDFASMFLKTYESLEHVGGVVTPADDEKLKNLFKIIFNEMAKRRSLFLQTGVSSYMSYLETGKNDLPQIVLMIDNLTVLKEMYLEEDDDFIMICREGSALGINVIIANSTTAGIGYKYLSNFSCKIALFNNDSGEYSTLFDHCRETLPDIKGRSLIEIEKEFYECQTYLSFEGEKEVDKLEAIDLFITENNSKNTGKPAHQIPEIPEKLTIDYLEENCELNKTKFTIPLGLNFDNVNPLYLNLSKFSKPLMISGKDNAGQKEILTYIVNMLEQQWPGESEVYIVDNMNKEFDSIKNNSNIKEYSLLFSKSCEYLQKIAEVAESRYDTLSSGEELDLSSQSLQVLILNNADVFDAISNDMEAYEAFENLISKYKSMNICIIVNQVENVSISYNAPAMLRDLKDGGHILFFDDLNLMQVADIPYNLLQQFNKRLSYNEAYYFERDKCIKVKLISE